MKNLIFLFFFAIVLILFTKTSNIQAQTCGGYATCCDQVRDCNPKPCGGYLEPACVCDTVCSGASYNVGCEVTGFGCVAERCLRLDEAYEDNTCGWISPPPPPPPHCGTVGSESGVHL